MDKRTELIITALQQRIGELVTNYETQIAVMRADFTSQMQEVQEAEQSKQEAMHEYSQNLTQIQE